MDASQRVWFNKHSTTYTHGPDKPCWDIYIDTSGWRPSPTNQAARLMVHTPDPERAVQELGDLLGAFSALYAELKRSLRPDNTPDTQPTPSPAE